MILDIGLGILAAISTSFLFNSDLTAQFVIFGIIFALLPDIDVLWGALMQKRRWWQRGMWSHREFTHYPLIHMSVSVILYFLVGGVWALLYLLCIFSHLIHDSVADGWGVKWLWPFNKKAYRFFYKGKVASSADWNEVGHGHTGDWTSWIKDMYVRKYLPYEIVVLLASLLILFVYAK